MSRYEMNTLRSLINVCYATIEAEVVDTVCIDDLLRNVLTARITMCAKKNAEDISKALKPGIQQESRERVYIINMQMNYCIIMLKMLGGSDLMRDLCPLLCSCHCFILTTLSLRN